MNHTAPKSYRGEGSTLAAGLIAEGGVLSVKKKQSTVIIYKVN